MVTFRSNNGFRTFYEKSIRVDESKDIDWTPHTIDYAAFKRRLLAFNKRRAKLRHRLAINDFVLYGDLDAMLQETRMEAPTPQRVSGNVDNMTSMLTDNGKVAPSSVPMNQRASSFQLGYVPMGDESASGNGGGGAGGRPPQQIELSQRRSQDQNETSTNTLGEDVPPSMVVFSPSGDSKSLGSQDLHRSGSSKSAGAVGGLFGTTPAVPKEFRELNRRSVMKRVSNAERREIVTFLAWEVDKVTMFYLAQWQRLSTALVEYSSGNPQPMGTVLQQLGSELLELQAFCCLNLVAVRQILFRYDAFCRTFEGTPMLNYYMKHVRSQATSFRKLLYHEELNALISSFLEHAAPNTTLVQSFKEQRDWLRTQVLEPSESAEATSSAGHVHGQDSWLHTLRYYFLLGAMEDRLGLEPAYLLNRGKSLTTEVKALLEWHERRKSNNPYPYSRPPTDMFVDDDDDDDMDDPSKHMSWQQTFNLAMALMGAFLYCMNYYIVEPSSTMYVNELGASDAMSGLLIGMMPLASFCAALFFSLWTNDSFLHPFLVSGLLMVTGNCIYSAAYNFKSFEMALVGRFMTGLGGPKCIIRRYMADTTTLSIRTSINALFGMMVAAGSALGPGMAIILSRYDNVKIPLPGGDADIIINGMTGPGYMMASLWFVFAILLAAFFRDPPRYGLEEQKRLEAATRSATTEDFGDTSSTHDSTSSKIMSMATTDSVVGENLKATGTDHQDDLMTMYSGGVSVFGKDDDGESQALRRAAKESSNNKPESMMEEFKSFSRHVTFPVRLCLSLLFAKVFVIEALVSATSSVTKNRYQWKVKQVGTLGCVNGFTVIPLSMIIGRLSMSYQDRQLMFALLLVGLVGTALLVDISDLTNPSAEYYNWGEPLAVGPERYVAGYFLTYVSIQSFEGVIGSTLSKVIPTALASGTLNSGLLATLVDTFGRACGDLFISFMGSISLRQLMNLLFIPSFTILLICVIVVRRYYDVLAV